MFGPATPLQHRPPARTTRHTSAVGIALSVVILLIAAVAIACAPATGPVEHAPDFTLSAADGSQVALSDLLDEHRAVVLVFYRGFF